jgi:hypothetical protein
MKNSSLLLVLSGLILSACATKEVDPVRIVDGDEVFYATIEEPTSRVYVDEGLRVLWNADDRVSIFNRYTYNRQYRFEGKDGDNSGSFTQVPDDAFVVGNALDKVYAVYPYREDTRITNDGEMTVILPSEQSYRADSFGPGVNTMISVTEDNYLLFKNLCGYLTVRLFGDNVSVSSISLRGNNAEPLAGQATVVARTDQAPSLTFDASATQELSIHFDTPVLLGDSVENATVFWLVVPPVTFSQGFTMTVTDDQGGQFVKSASSSITIERNVLSKMAALRVGDSVPGEVTGISLDKTELTLIVGQSAVLLATVRPEDAADKTVTWTSSDASVATVDGEGRVTAVAPGTATITADASGWTATCIVTVKNIDANASIQFADEKVKAKLVAAFDTDGDGELSYAEAAAVSSAEALKSAFGAIKTYKSFDEFQFFTGVETIPDSMFEAWNLLSSIVIPHTVKSIGSQAFSGCASLTSVVIPDGVTSIGSSAFNGCKLTTIDLPLSVKQVGSRAFAHNGEEIVMSGKCFRLDDIADPACIVKYTVLEGETYVVPGAFAGCTNLASVIIPEGVLSIGTRAFSGCKSLTSVPLPESLAKIEEAAFSGCVGLTSIDIPDSVTSIEGWAFSGCTSLTSIVIPKRITSIGFMLFSGCTSLTSVVIPESVTTIGNSAFSGCTSLTSFLIPESVTSIGTYAFSGCAGLTSFVIPERVTSLGSAAFYECTGLTSVDIPEGITSIGYQLFYGCESLMSVMIPESVTSIGGSAFSKCASLESIVIPENVTAIGESAFSECTGLTSIVIPESISSIGRAVFSECTGLTSVLIPESVSSIGESAFSKCTSLTSLTIPESVTSIGHMAFSGCTSLTSIVVPEGVTSIGNSAFNGCSSLTSAIIPEGVTSIGNETFFGCKSLTSFSIPESVTSIGTYAFSECSGLTSIVIPKGVTAIGNYAFSSCIRLTSVTILPVTPPSGGSSMFYNTSECPLYVPANSVDKYKSANYWKNYSSRIQAIPE